MKIAYCGHSHHRTTRSVAFLLEALRSRCDVQTFWDESWKTHTPFDVAPVVGGRFDAVVVVQVQETAAQISRAGLPNVTFFPMYDAAHGLPDGYWRSLGGTKVVCFSSTLHERLQRLEVRSRFVRYYPDPDAVGRASREPGLAGYFWQRQQDVTWKTIKGLIGDARFRSFTLHTAIDPTFGEFVAPSDEDVARHLIRTTNWFPTREEAAADLARHNVYFAPRLREGIGMSFLEAMAMGFLVVAPDRPTMSEYIVSGETGLLYDPEKPAPLDFSRWEEMGDRARRHVEAGRRKWLRCVEPLLDLVAAPNASVPVWAPIDALDPLATESGASRRGGTPPRAEPGRAAPRNPVPSFGMMEGGRRLRDANGHGSASPLVTVAVVTKNAEKSLAGTLDSVLAQDLPGIEVVVLDGASEDSTLDVLRGYEERIDYWRSAKDRGPYEAMNAAAAAAWGRYVIFMNAGDRFQTTDALSLALDGAPPDADVVFGHHVYRDISGHDALHHSASFAETWARLRGGDISWQWLSKVPCHQATLTRVALLRRNPYRTDLRIAADHELLYRLARQGARFHHSTAVVATYVSGGLSWRSQDRCFAEWRQIAMEYSEDPAAASRRFANMMSKMRRSDLPTVPLWELVSFIGRRVPGATRELKRRIRLRFARAFARSHV